MSENSEKIRLFMGVITGLGQITHIWKNKRDVLLVQISVDEADLSALPEGITKENLIEKINTTTKEVYNINTDIDKHERNIKKYQEEMADLEGKEAVKEGTGGVPFNHPDETKWNGGKRSSKRKTRKHKRHRRKKTKRKIKRKTKRKIKRKTKRKLR